MRAPNLIRKNSPVAGDAPHNSTSQDRRVQTQSLSRRTHSYRDRNPGDQGTVRAGLMCLMQRPSPPPVRAEAEQSFCGWSEPLWMPFRLATYRRLPQATGSEQANEWHHRQAEPKFTDAERM